MLIKLMKHELRATGRVMVPALLILLATALGARLSTAGMILQDNGFLQVLGGLLLTAYMIALAAVMIVCFVFMLVRFGKNFMGDEGYLMFTLPVSVHQLVWSKLLTALIWMALTAAGVAASLLLLLMLPVDWFRVNFAEVTQVFTSLLDHLGPQAWWMGAAILAMTVLGLLVGLLQFYASMAVGCSFSNHKVVLSILTFFGFQIVLNLAGSLRSKVSLNVVPLLTGEPGYYEIGSVIWRSVGLELVVMLATFAVFYFLTTWFLKRRLNLE